MRVRCALGGTRSAVAFAFRTFFRRGHSSRQNPTECVPPRQWKSLYQAREGDALTFAKPCSATSINDSKLSKSGKRRWAGKPVGIGAHLAWGIRSCVPAPPRCSSKNTPPGFMQHGAEIALSTPEGLPESGFQSDPQVPSNPCSDQKAYPSGPSVTGYRAGRYPSVQPFVLFPSSVTRAGVTQQRVGVMRPSRWGTSHDK